jgi:hypothetical protein
VTQVTANRWREEYPDERYGSCGCDQPGEGDLKQTILAFCSRVRPGSLEQLEQMLAPIGEDPARNEYVPFGAVRSLHFASFAIMNDRDSGPWLVFENNFDGSLDTYLDDLLNHCGRGLRAIYQCCEGFATPDGAEQDGLGAYLRAHVVWPSAAHVGNVGRSVKRIKQERALRQVLDEELDTLLRSDQPPSRPGEIRRSLQRSIGQSPKTREWIINSPPRQTWLEAWLPWVRIGALVVGAVLLSPLLLPAAVVWVRRLQHQEARDEPWKELPPSDLLRRVEAAEDRSGSVQNHVVSLAYIKPGRFRKMTIRLVLWLVSLNASVSRNGKLGDIATIHFAQWSLLGDGDRLLFLSNFDGSWQSYLDDFIDLSSLGLTAVWSNTEGFPRTRWRIFEGLLETRRAGIGDGSQFLEGGAEDGPRFKAIARNTMAVTNVWYSAYPSLTVQQIDENSDIRERLFTPLDPAGEQEWLRHF